MKRRIVVGLIVLLTALSIWGCRSANVSGGAGGGTLPGDRDVTVYIGNMTGHKYHRIDCKQLNGLRVSLKLAQAISSGYKPCNVCNPPQ